MVSIKTYIDKAICCQNYVYEHRWGTPYIYGDATFKSIKQNALDCVFNGCKAILTQSRISVSLNREEAIQYVRTNHEIGCLINTIMNCISEWEFNVLNRNDSFAESWIHDLVCRLKDFCCYLNSNVM